MKKLTLILLFGFGVSLAQAASIGENVSSGNTLREAVNQTFASGDLDVGGVFTAMDSGSLEPALVFLYSVEADQGLLEGLVAASQPRHADAIIDAVLLAVKFDLPVLEALLSALALGSVELSTEVIRAVVQVFPGKAIAVLDILIAANPDAKDVFQSAYDAAVAAGDGPSGDLELYEMFEPEDDVSPS